MISWDEGSEWEGKTIHGVELDWLGGLGMDTSDVFVGVHASFVDEVVGVFLFLSAV
jgi:hypothetical protein